jgi:ParB family chromosome partitioning protein
MASAVQKIKLSPSRDIPFNKLVLSQSNVRRTKAGISIEDLAQDIAHRQKLLQSLSVRPILDAEGKDTGMFEVPAGGRRYRALELLVRQKQLAKTAPVPCIVSDADTAISAEEDSLAENVHRVALHPLDQFRAFQTLREQGRSEEDIATIFFVSVNVVKQRLRLATISPKLHEVYAEDGMTLEQLMAFSVTGDQARQEQIWENVSRSGYDEPYQIRRMLTENSVRASDRRAQFVGLDVYERAGGGVLRDLFEHDDGGWLQDVVLLDRLVTEKLKAEAETIAKEGWKWISVAVDFPYGHATGLRELDGKPADLTTEEQATIDALNAEQAKLESDYQDADELPDEVDQRLGEIEQALMAFEDRPVLYDPAEIARAGVFISIDSEGRLSVDRGYVRAEDDVPATEPDVEQGADPSSIEAQETGASVQRTVIAVAGSAVEADEDDEDAAKPLPDRLVTELTAHRTLALRDALAENPAIAFQAVLHNFVLTAFYRFASSGSCLEIGLHTPTFPAQAPGLRESASAKAVEARHESWKARLPTQGARLVGIYDSQVAFGQSRVLLVWTRLIMPNGRSIVLERQPGADAAGYSGLKDEVDNHWKELLAAAALSTLLGVGSELGSGADSGSNTAILQALRMGAANSLNQTGQQVVRRNLSIQPTLTIRPGFLVGVIVNRDIVLEPYRG